VILEAEAAGVPLIATDVGACREMLEGGTPEDRALGASGLITRIASPEDTAQALVQMAKNPAMRKKMAEAGRRRVATFYRRDRLIESYRDLYQRLSDAPSAGLS
jgi:glycosyltransferase involved in cell wall biosynthesis